MMGKPKRMAMMAVRRWPARSQMAPAMGLRIRNGAARAKPTAPSQAG